MKNIKKILVKVNREFYIIILEKKRDQETVLKMKESLKIYYKNNKHPRLGIKKTEEEKEKLRKNIVIINIANEVVLKDSTVNIMKNLKISYPKLRRYLKEEKFID